MARLSATWVLWVIAAAALIVVGLPLWKPLLLAAVLAGTLSRLHERLAAAVGGRRSLSAALITVGIVLLLLGPLCFIAAVAVKEALGAIAFVSHPLEQKGLPGLWGRLPDWLVHWVNSALARGSRAQHSFAPDLANWPRLQQTLGAAAGIVGSTSHLLLMTVLMLVALFFLLRDGHALILWIEGTPTMPPGRARSLLVELRTVSRSVLGAQLASGLAQSVVATVGYAIAGVPRPLVFGIVSLVASLFPIGGVSLVGLPLAGLLWLTGRPGWAIFLAIWTAVPTGLIDNVVRPLLVRGKKPLHDGLVFFALLGGLLAFGPMGIVVGPLALALFLSVSAIQRHDHN
ncbi:MAG TPA: AI-2E family transporter [Polyangia bacterium]|nr:AI-2E family transporter [Polyangia bacterium]